MNTLFVLSSTATLLLLLFYCCCRVDAFLPAQNPRWPPTYNMSLSTVITGMNTTGYIDPALASQWGMIFYDWSNAKQLWCNTSPMNCEERLVEQARMTKALNPHTRVFVYRNLVKALPWYTSVRTKLDDPTYSGFFLSFKPGGTFPNGTYYVPACTTSGPTTKCSTYYHDQEQTPQVPTPTDPHPDGACDVECDCGLNPCGEYLWDHRNGSMLTEYLVSHHIFGKNGLDDPDIDGLFIDDFWCSNILNKTCNDPVQGPTEIDPHSQLDMGLSDSDILSLTKAWLNNMESVQLAIVEKNKFTWSLFPGQQNANLMPELVTPSTCTSFHRASCQPYNPWLSVPLILGVQPDNNDPRSLPWLEQTVAVFLLSRGPYAWLGYGNWGVGWPWSLPRPAQFDTDYGEPFDPFCYETGHDTNVFTRRWTNYRITLDCTNWKATFEKV